MDDLNEAVLSHVAAEWLPAWLRSRRWFGGRDREIRDCRIRHFTPLGPALLCAVETHIADSSPETYLIPLMLVPSAEATAVVATIDGRVLVEATHVPEFRSALFRVLAGWESAPGVRAEQAREFACAFPKDVPTSRVLSVEQSNTSLVYGERLFLKWFRKLEPGLNPDVEMLRFLEGRGTPAFLGALSWMDGSLAVATEFFPGATDAWSMATQTSGEEWLPLARQLGEATGRMHLALASNPGDLAFAPEPITRDDVEAYARSMLTTASEALSEMPETGDAQVAELLEALDGMRPVQRVLDRIQSHEPQGVKIRTHGDYHLGQVLSPAEGWKITDFEGEPLRSPKERRRKYPAVRDVAGMLRSLDYAAGVRGTHCADHEAFLEGWRSVVVGAELANEALLPLFLLEKAFYELRYELRHRPNWAAIPMRGIVELCRA